MSERPSLSLNEDFVRDYYVQTLTERQVRIVLDAWIPFAEDIARLLGDFEPDEQSWRTYRNAAFPNLGLPDPLASLARIQDFCCTAARSLLRWGYCGDDPAPSQPRWIMVDAPMRFFAWCPYCGTPRLEDDFLSGKDKDVRLTEGGQYYLKGLEATLKLQARSLAHMQERVNDRPKVEGLIRKKDAVIQQLTATNENLRGECARLTKVVTDMQALVNPAVRKP